MKRIALLGFGAIGKSILEHWGTLPRDAYELAAVCMKSDQVTTGAAIPQGARIVVDPQDLLALDCEAIIEAAGHRALQAYGAHFLRRKIDLYILSVGALADEALLTAFHLASAAGGGRLHIANGAIAGLDGLRTMKVLGLHSVQYRGIKPPGAWPASPPRAALSEEGATSIIFDGSARQVAHRYPKNANVAAAVALAGIGFDATRVTLISDPATEANTHEISATGVTGTLNVRVAGRALADNPKSSASAGMSILAALRNGVAMPALL